MEKGISRIIYMMLPRHCVFYQIDTKSRYNNTAGVYRITCESVTRRHPSKLLYIQPLLEIQHEHDLYVTIKLLLHHSLIINPPFQQRSHLYENIFKFLLKQWRMLAAIQHLAVVRVFACHHPAYTTRRSSCLQYLPSDHSVLLIHQSMQYF